MKTDELELHSHILGQGYISGEPVLGVIPDLEAIEQACMLPDLKRLPIYTSKILGASDMRRVNARLVDLIRSFYSFVLLFAKRKFGKDGGSTRIVLLQSSMLSCEAPFLQKQSMFEGNHGSLQ